MTLSLAPSTTTVREVEALLDAIDAKFAAVEQLDARGLSGPALAALVVRMQRFADRYTTHLARFLGEADRAAVWASSGSRSIAGWLADQTNTAYGRAVEMVKLSDAMQASPLLAERLQSGDISTATAVALHPVVVAPPAGADPAAVDVLVERCTGTAPREAKEAVEHWRALHHDDTPEALEARRYAARSVRFAHPVDGTVTTTAVLPTLHADQLRKLLGTLGGTPTVDDPRTSEQCYADGLLALIDVGVRTDTVAGRRSATILVTIDADSLAGSSDAPGTTEFGHHIPAHVVRLMAENALLHRVMVADSVVLDVGRGQRLATDAQYAALLARDGGCRVRGCAMPAAWCEVDHIRPWLDGGTTDLGNLWLLCAHHHRVKHRPGVQVIGHGHELSLLLPDGGRIDCPPRARPAPAAA